MSANNKGKEFPTEVQIGDVTYKVSDTPLLKQFFEEVVTIASQREKDKLYPTITAKDAKIKTLEEELAKANSDSQEIMATFQKSAAENAELRKKLDAVNSTQPIDPNTIRKMIQEEFASKIPSATAEAINPLKQEVTALNEKRLTEYKLRRIAEEGSAIIPELVNGNTEEEIENSIKFSKEVRSKYAAPDVQQPAQQNDQNMNQPNNTQQQQQGNNAQQQQQPPAATPKVVSPGMDGIPDIKNMSPEEFAANRSSLLEKMKSFEGTV